MKSATKLLLLPIITITASSLFLVSCGDKKEEATETNTEASEGEKAEVVKKDTLASLTDELVVQLNQYADIVLAVKDTATAQEAVGNLDKVGDAIGAIAARLDKIEMPDEATNIAVDEKMKNASMAIQQKMQAAGQIMSNQEVAAVLIPALQNFGMRMAEHEKVFMRFGSQKDQPAAEQQTSDAQVPETTSTEAPAATDAAEEAAQDVATEAVEKVEEQSADKAAPVAE